MGHLIRCLRNQVCAYLTKSQDGLSVRSAGIQKDSPSSNQCQVSDMSLHFIFILTCISLRMDRDGVIKSRNSWIPTGKGLTTFAHLEMHVATELVDAQALLHRVALIPDENIKAGELARPLRR